MNRRQLFAALICAATLFGSGSIASAGEYTGNDTDTPIKTRGVAASACAFSGRDQPDTGSNPEDHHGGPGDDAEWASTPAGGLVQSPGQIVATLGPKNEFAPAGTPGQACRGGGPG